MSTAKEATATKRSRDQDGEDDYSSGEESSEGESPATAVAAAAAGAIRPRQGVGMATLENLKRDKRLAMNRESARARRRRKKIRLETLEHRAEGISQRHHALVLENQGLKSRVVQLEAELASRRTLGGGGAVAALQQQAAMAARMGGGGPSAAMPFGMTGAGGMGTDPELQYLQMQMMSGRAAPGAAGGSVSGRTARLAAMPDIQSQMQNQYGAIPGGAGGGGQLSDIGRRNSLELGRIQRGGSERGGPSLMDLASQGNNNSPNGRHRGEGKSSELYGMMAANNSKTKFPKRN